MSVKIEELATYFTQHAKYISWLSKITLRITMKL